jgi:hypothetical protein
MNSKTEFNSTLNSARLHQEFSKVTAPPLKQAVIPLLKLG